MAMRSSSSRPSSAPSTTSASGSKRLMPNQPGATRPATSRGAAERQPKPRPYGHSAERKQMDTDIARLRAALERNGFLGTLTTENLRQFLIHTEQITMSAACEVKRGMGAKELILVVEGELNFMLAQRGSDEPEQKYVTGRPGDTFGELNVVEGSKDSHGSMTQFARCLCFNRCSKVWTKTPVVLRAIGRNAFQQVILPCMRRMQYAHVTFLMTEVPFLSLMDDGGQYAIASSVEVVDFADGEDIVKENKRSSELFIIMEGKAVISRFEPNFSIRVKLKRIGPGDHLGDGSLVGTAPNAPEGITATAQGRVRCLALPEFHFKRLFPPSTSWLYDRVKAAQQQTHATFTEFKLRRLRLQQLLAAERDLVVHCRLLFKSFIAPLMAQSVLPKRDLARICPNVDHLILSGKQRVAIVANALSDLPGQALGASIATMHLQLLPCIRYASNGARAVQHLAAFMQHREFAAFVDQMEQTTQYPFVVYLLMPVRFIEHVIVTLRHLLQCTRQEHRDYGSLKELCSQLDKCTRTDEWALSCLESIRALQRTRRFVFPAPSADMSSSFLGDVAAEAAALTTQRELVLSSCHRQSLREDDLLVHRSNEFFYATRESEPRLIVTFSDAVASLFHDTSEVTQGLPRNTMDRLLRLHRGRVETLDDFEELRDAAMVTDMFNHTLVIAFKTTEARDEWVSLVQDLIDRLHRVVNPPFVHAVADVVHNKIYDNKGNGNGNDENNNSFELHRNNVSATYAVSSP